MNSAMLVLVLYVATSVIWLAYIAKPSRPLKNWQWLLSWTLFLPTVLACMLFAAVSKLAEWLMGES